jgi:hypothetical protein
MLPETKELTYRAMKVCHELDVPFKILTKCTKWVGDPFIEEFYNIGKVWGEPPKMDLFAFGFSLTGHDEIEIDADPNSERLESLIKLKKMGFKTFASFEPVIDYDSTYKMIESSYKHCDFMRIGLLNGPTRDKNPNLEEMINFFKRVTDLVKDVPIYWGDSIVQNLHLNREFMPQNCVEEEIF